MFFSGNESLIDAITSLVAENFCLTEHEKFYRLYDENGEQVYNKKGKEVMSDIEMSPDHNNIVLSGGIMNYNIIADEIK